MTDIRHQPGPVIELWDWQLRGRCRGLGSELFFHLDSERGPQRDARDLAAKRFCQGCEVFLTCRQHALDSREP